MTVRGTGEQASVVDNSLQVISIAYPPFLKEQKIIPYRSYLTSSTGATDMRVVGSLAAPIQFYIPANPINDRYISKISFLIADAGAVFNGFGKLAALTNGCRFFYERRTSGEIIFHSALKSNFDFCRMCLFNPPIGSGVDLLLGKNVIGTSDGFLPVLDLSALIPPYGLKLDAGTKQKIILEIRDNTSGVTGFDAIAYGFDRLP